MHVCMYTYMYSHTNTDIYIYIYNPVLGSPTTRGSRPKTPDPCDSAHFSGTTLP